jgi:hypothetical protein
LEFGNFTLPMRPVNPRRGGSPLAG